MPLLPSKKEEKEDEKEVEKVEYTIYKKILLIVCQAFKLIKTWRESENPEDLPLDNVALDMIANKKARLNHLGNEASNDFIFKFEAIVGQIQYWKDDAVVLPEWAQKKDAGVHFVIKVVDVLNSFQSVRQEPQVTDYQSDTSEDSSLDKDKV